MKTGQLPFKLFVTGLLLLVSLPILAQTDILSIINSGDPGQFFDIRDQVAAFGRGIYDQSGLDDLSINYLGRLFGQVSDVLPHASRNMMNQVFGYFNTGIFTVATGMAGFTTIHTVINTSREGKVMGERGRVFWVFIRTFMGAALLLPRFAGYSAIQVLVMWAAVQGAHVANGVWGGVQQVIESNQTQAQHNPSKYDLAAPPTPEILKQQRVAATSTILRLFQGELCAAYNRMYEAQQNYDNALYYQQMQAQGVTELSRFTPSSDNHTFNYGPARDEEPYPYADCGTFRVSFDLPDENPAFLAGKMRALRQTSEHRLRDLADQVMTQYREPDTTYLRCMSGSDISQCPEARRIGERIYDAAEYFRTQVLAAYVAAKQAQETQESQVQTTEADVNPVTLKALGGWITAGMLYENLMGEASIAPLSGMRDTIFQVGTPFGWFAGVQPFSDPLGVDGLIGSSAMAMIPGVSQHRSSAINAGTDNTSAYVTTLLEGLMQHDQSSIGPETHARLQKIKSMLDQSVYGLTPELGKQRALLDDPDNYYSSVLPAQITEMENRQRSLGGAVACSLGLPKLCKSDSRSMYSMLIKPQSWAPMGPAKFKSKFLHRDTAVFLGTIAKAWRDMVNKSSLTNPIVNIRAYGNALIQSSVTYMVYATQDMFYEWFSGQVFWLQYGALIGMVGKIIKLVGTLLQWVGGVLMPVPIIGTILWLVLDVIAGFAVHMISAYFDVLQYSAQMARKAEMAFKFYHVPIVVAAASSLLSFGMLLALYIPIIPFFMFAVAVVSWFLSVVEGMLAAPLIALGITHPQGHDFLGRAEQAMILLLSVFARPVAILLGFVFGLMMAHASIWLFNQMIMVPLFHHMEYAMLTGSPFGRYVMVLVLTVLYSYVILTVLDETFSMVYKLPNQLMRWLDPRYHQQSDEIQILAQAQQGFGGTTEKASQGGQQTVTAMQSTLQQRF